MTTRKQRRKDNLAAGKLTPAWMRDHNGSPLQQWWRQFNRRPR